MKKLLALSFSALFSVSAFSMACDTGYSCKSESGKYQVELQRCRYVKGGLKYGGWQMNSRPPKMAFSCLPTK